MLAQKPNLKNLQTVRNYMVSLQYLLSLNNVMLLNYFQFHEDREEYQCIMKLFWDTNVQEIRKNEARFQLQGYCDKSG